MVKDLDFGDKEEFTLVGAGEEDYDSGKILVTSPLAQGLSGKKVASGSKSPCRKARSDSRSWRSARRSRSLLPKGSIRAVRPNRFSSDLTESTPYSSVTSQPLLP